MLTLEVVQAAFGDCFLLHYGTAAAPRAMVIDGGPEGTYADHLGPILRGLAAEGVPLDVVLLSHIDNDHVGGLLELFTDLAADAKRPKRMLPKVGALWHNAFGLSVGGDDLAPRVRAALSSIDAVAPGIRGIASQLQGVAEGDLLRADAIALGVPIDPGFPDDHILADDAPTVALGPLTTEVAGPSRQSLRNLRQHWQRWLRAHPERASGAAAGPATPGQGAQPAPPPRDQSVPNLSSIMLLVRQGRQSALLTGDGRGDQIVDGLRQRGLLDASGRLHVDLLKVQHHGSARNASPEFFRMITADRYVISADGRYGNPDFACLVWLVDAAVAAHREIELVLTNETDASRRLRAARPPEECGYRITLLEPGAHSLLVPLGQAGGRGDAGAGQGSAG